MEQAVELEKIAPPLFNSNNVNSGNNNNNNVSPHQAQLFESVFQFSPIPMAIITVTENFVACNHLFCELLGYPDDESIKQHPVSYFTRNSSYVFNEQLMQKVQHCGSIQQQQQNKIPLALTRRDGTMVETSSTLGVIRDVFGNGSFFVVSVVQYKAL